MDRIFHPLRAVFEERFIVSSKNRIRKSHPVVVLKCCNISNTKDMPGVKHGCMFFPCLGFLSTRDNVIELKRKKEGHYANMEKVLYRRKSSSQTAEMSGTG